MAPPPHESRRQGEKENTDGHTGWVYHRQDVPQQHLRDAISNGASNGVSAIIACITTVYMLTGPGTDPLTKHAVDSIYILKC